MTHRTKPTEWKLNGMSDAELLSIATGKLRQRTIREGEKMDKAFEDGKRDEKQRSKFYSLWYAFEALRIYNQRHGVKVAEPFLERPPVKEITVPKTWEFIDPKTIFTIPVSHWHRFSKQDQKFLKTNKGFFLKQLGYPLIHTDQGTFFDWGQDENRR